MHSMYNIFGQYKCLASPQLLIKWHNTFINC